MSKEEESLKDYILRKSKDKLWKMEGIVSCFCDTCKKEDVYHKDGDEPIENSIDCVAYEYLTLFCNICGKYGNLKVCQKCKLGFYCSRECQIIDHPFHKRLCGENIFDSNKRGPNVFFQFGVGKYLWKGFLQFNEDSIMKRLKEGIRLYTLIQFNDHEIRGCANDVIDKVEMIQNNLKVLGVFTSLQIAIRHQKESLRSVQKRVKKTKYIQGQCKMSDPPYKILKNGLDLGLVLGEKRGIRFMIIPFIADKKNIFVDHPHDDNDNNNNISLGVQLSGKRIKFLLSYYWSDVSHRDCLKILDFFQDEKIGFQIAEERESVVKVRYDFREREIPTLMKNEERKIFQKSKADICHYDIVDIEVDKVYTPYLIMEELLKENFVLFCQLSL